MLKISTLKELYPNPVEIYGNEDNPECYCVGGALVIEYYKTSKYKRNLPEKKFRFPARDLLTNVICTINPKINRKAARVLAGLIIKLNDDALFHMAWDTLDEAINGSEFHMYDI